MGAVIKVGQLRRNADRVECRARIYLVDEIANRGQKMRSFLRRIIPGPVRALPWRVGWLHGTKTYNQNPAVSVAKLIRWTCLELIDRDVEVVTADGHRLRSTARNFTSLSVHLTGERDPELQAFIARRLLPGSTFIDIAANIGVYTVFASRLVGELGRVVSIEANPTTYKFLAENIELNNLANVTPLNCAAGDTPGEISMAANQRNAGESHIATDSEGGVVVAVERLDELLVRLGVGEVDYLKIDVEGFELPVLRGALATIGKNVNIVVQTELVEAHARRYGHSVTEIVGLMTQLGLRPHQPDAMGQALPFKIPEIAPACDVLWMR